MRAAQTIEKQHLHRKTKHLGLGEEGQSTRPLAALKAWAKQQLMVEPASGGAPTNKH